MNKSASRAAEIFWNNGNSVVLWLDGNSNTGDMIVYQVVKRNGKPDRPRRVSGRNIPKLTAEIKAALAASEGILEIYNEAAYAAFMKS